MKFAILAIIGTVSAIRISYDSSAESAAVPIDEYTFSEHDATNKEIKAAWSEMETKKSLAE